MARRTQTQLGGNGPLETEIDSLLPASSRKDHRIVLPSKNPNNFLQSLEDDFSVKRIDDIYAHLWMVCRPFPPRPLNTQRVRDRTIIPSNDTSLHLVWTTGKIYMRPVPSFILCESFYEHYLSPNNLSEHTKPVLGLLYSYIAMLPSELDFDIAQNTGLIPDEYKWQDWKHLVRRVLAEYDDIVPKLPVRYQYGELRLDRLDKIYRYMRGDWLHGYSRLHLSLRLRQLVQASSFPGLFLREDEAPEAS